MYLRYIRPPPQLIENGNYNLEEQPPELIENVLSILIKVVPDIKFHPIAVTR